MPGGRRLCLMLAAGAAVCVQGARPEDAALLARELAAPVAQLPAWMDAAESAAPDVQRRLAGLMQAEAGVLAARAERLPRVRAGVQAGGLFEDRELEGDRSLGVVLYSASATQPLWHWGSLEQAEARARLMAGVAQRDREQGALLARLEALRGWNALLEAELHARLDRVRVQRLARDLEFERMQLESGRRAAQGMEELEDGLAEAEFILARTELRLEGARALVQALTGARPDGAGEPGPVADASGFAERLAGLPAPAGSVRREVLTALIEAERLQQAIEGKRLLPKVGVSVLASRENRNPDNDPLGRTQLVHAAGVYAVADWLVFDGHAARAAGMQARARQRSLELEQGQVIREEREQAERVVLAAREAARRVETAERKLAEAEALGRAARANHELGLISLRELEDSGQQVEDARRVLFFARADLHVACAQVFVMHGVRIYPGTGEAPVP